MQELLTWHHIFRPAVIAGVSGSLTAVALSREGTWGDAIGEAFVGVAFAIYISPAMWEVIGMQAESYHNALAFINGAIGVIVLRAVRMWLQKSGVIERWLRRAEEKHLGH